MVRRKRFQQKRRKRIISDRLTGGRATSVKHVCTPAYFVFAYRKTAHEKEDGGLLITNIIKRKLSETHIVTRLAVYLAGLFVLSLGLALFLQSELGLPVNSSVAYVLSRIFSLRYSVCLVLVNVLLVFIQLAVLRRDFRPVSFLQIPLSFLFGWFVDLTCRLTANIQPSGYLASFAVMVLGIVFLGLGLSLYVQTELIPLPLEGLALAVTKKLVRFPLFAVKRALDISLLLISVTLSLVFLHHLEGVREGTAVAALFAGRLMGVFQQHISLHFSEGLTYKNSRDNAQGGNHG